jgi:hypothetical protein
LPELVRLSHHPVTGPFKRRFEVLDRYRRQRLANATVDRVGGNSVPPTVPDDGNGGLHLRFGHFALVNVASARRFHASGLCLIPVTTKSTLRLPHCENTSRLPQSGTVVSGRSQVWHQTMNFRWAAAALPSVSPEQMRTRADECERLAKSLGPDSLEIRATLFGVAEQWRKLADNEKAHALRPSSLAGFQTG